MDEYVSGEKHKSAQAAKLPQKGKAKLIGIGLAFIVVIFLGGMLLVKQSHRSQNTPVYGVNGAPVSGGSGPAPVSCAGSACNQNQQSGQGLPPVVGTVTAVSKTSITVKPTDGGGTRTFTITGDTKEVSSPDANTGPSSSGPSAYAYDVKVGDSVAVEPSSTDGTLAKTILPNKQTTNVN